ncbi:hypothetical protein RRG08_050471 [Elysia crispata]|uniref:Uncharacterized protein n=1 Tax=Elysia crispata TaxID=231223 RepID=A0AAE0YCL3_9GAST|nr:hypothetical protein RRG08_050471 [Elysia crispata]
MKSKKCNHCQGLATSLNEINGGNLWRLIPLKAGTSSPSGDGTSQGLLWTRPLAGTINTHFGFLAAGFELETDKSNNIARLGNLFVLTLIADPVLGYLHSTNPLLAQRVDNPRGWNLTTGCILCLEAVVLKTDQREKRGRGGKLFYREVFLLQEPRVMAPHPDSYWAPERHSDGSTAHVRKIVASSIIRRRALRVTADPTNEQARPISPSAFCQMQYDAFKEGQKSTRNQQNLFIFSFLSTSSSDGVPAALGYSLPYPSPQDK